MPSANDLNRALTVQQGAANDRVSSRQIIDVCRPYGRKDFPVVSAVTPEYKKRVQRSGGLDR